MEKIQMLNFVLNLKRIAHHVLQRSGSFIAEQKEENFILKFISSFLRLNF